MKTTIKKQKLSRTNLSIVGILMLLSCISFFIGIHWQGTISQWLVKNNIVRNLSCFGHNNLTETFQFNCYAPLGQNKYQSFKNHLNCQVLTNHQMSNSNIENSQYNELMTIKSNYVTFSLDFDESKHIMTQSSQPGEPLKEPYAIVKNDEHVIQGIRNIKLPDDFGTEYDFITVSKKTGKGLNVWNNSEDNNNFDSIASEFFQCN